MQANEIILSGIQPTGELHIGNYLGAIANWVRLQDHYRCFYTIVDMHAMTMPYQPVHLRQKIEQMAIDLLACGIDLERAVLFIQSLVPEHAELCWIFNCVCSYGDLTRQTQFKDKSALLDRGGVSPEKFISAGLFTYPVLQAADILVYRAHYVPVGKDQMQHLELSRSIARRFNNQFGEFFPEPQVLLTDTPKIQSLANPTKKMSKQDGPKHYIGLFEDEGSIRAKIKSAVTDIGVLPPGKHMSEGVENLFGILRACGKVEQADEFLQEYNDGNRQYIRLKEAVADALVEILAPMRSKRAELMTDKETVVGRVRDMSAQAREVARETVHGVRALVGLPEHVMC